MTLRQMKPGDLTKILGGQSVVIFGAKRPPGLKASSASPTPAPSKDSATASRSASSNRSALPDLQNLPFDPAIETLRDAEIAGTLEAPLEEPRLERPQGPSKGSTTPTPED